MNAPNARTSVRAICAYTGLTHTLDLRCGVKRQRPVLLSWAKCP